MRKILCLIDSLGAGGAERQMSYLAILLKKAGHDVKLVAFTAKNKFYENFLIENGVTPDYNVKGVNKWRRIWEIAMLVKSYSPDLVIAYKDGVCISAILAKVLGNYNLAVSERTTTYRLTRFDKAKFFLYRFAQWIVPNSSSQAIFIKKHYPNLSSKIRIIRNTLDTSLFAPGMHSNEIPVVITTATIYKAKNTKALVRAAKILKDRGVRCIFRWYGKRFDNDTYPSEVETLISKNGLGETFQLLPAANDVNLLYKTADIFCLPSIVEGFPNVICEAMSSGLPVVCSNVCDNPYIVENDVNGYLFNPDNPTEIADKLQQMIEMSESQRLQMGAENRKKIIKLCAPDNFINSYLSLI